VPLSAHFNCVWSVHWWQLRVCVVVRQPVRAGALQEMEEMKEMVAPGRTARLPGQQQRGAAALSPCCERCLEPSIWQNICGHPKGAAASRPLFRYKKIKFLEVEPVDWKRELCRTGLTSVLLCKGCKFCPLFFPCLLLIPYAALKLWHSE